MSQVVKIWPQPPTRDQQEALGLHLVLDDEVLRVMKKEANDRHQSVEELIASLVRLAAMKSDYNERIHSAMGPIGLV